MKKKILTLALTLTTAVSSAAFVPAKTEAEALSSPIYGDANLDWQVNIADLVTFRNYLLGRYDFDGNQLFYCDMNKDGSTDIFDYILLKKQVETPAARFETGFTQVDTRGSYDNSYICGEEETIIHSVEELAEYFTVPDIGIDKNGEIRDCIVASDEVIADFKAKYDEKFFRENALMLSYIKGGTEYRFNSVRYINDDVSGKGAGRIVAEICDITPSDDPARESAPPVIAQVTIPKELVGNVYDMKFEWKMTADESCSAPDPEENAALKAVTELIVSAKEEAFLEAMAESDPVVIKSRGELEEYLEKRFYSAVSRGILKEYDEKFFEENVLILSLAYQKCGDRKQYAVEPVISGDTIKLTYSISYGNDGGAEGVLLSRVDVPKNAFEGCTVSRTHPNGTPIAAEHRELSDLRYPMNYDNYKNNSINGWFTEKAELYKAITDVYGEEMFSDLGADTIDWDSQAVYAWTGFGIGTARNTLLNTYLDGKCIKPTFISDQGLGDIAGNIVHLLITDKEFAEMAVAEEYYNHSDIMPICGDRCRIVDLSGSPSMIQGAFMLCECEYNGEHSMEVFTLGTGAGPVRYAGYTQIGSIKLPAGTTVIDDSDGGEYSFDGDDTAEYSSESFTVRFIRGEKTNKIILSTDGNDYEIEYSNK